MKVYDVTIHTRRGYRFIVDAHTEEEAKEQAFNQFVESDEDGLLIYEDTDRVDVEEMGTVEEVHA